MTNYGTGTYGSGTYGTLGTGTPTSNEVPFPCRGMFYYPWFPQTWGTQGQAANACGMAYPHTHFHPGGSRFAATGSTRYYDSSNVAVQNYHIDCMVHARMDLAISSWWSTDTVEHQRRHDRLKSMMDQAVTRGSSLLFCCYYEPVSIDLYWGPVSAPLSQTARRNRLIADMNYINSELANHATRGARYGRANGKPILMVWNARRGTADATFPNRFQEVCDDFDYANQNASTEFFIVLKVGSQPDGTGYTNVTPQPDAWHQYGPGSRMHKHPGTAGGSGLVPASKGAVVISPGFWHREDSSINAGVGGVLSCSATGTPRQRNRTFWQSDLAEMESNTAYRFHLVTSLNEHGEGHPLESVDQADSPETPWNSSSGYGTYLDDLRGDVIPPPPPGVNPGDWGYGTFGDSTFDGLDSTPVDPPPETTITAGPAEGSTTTDSTPTFSFTATDPGTTFEVRVDGGAWISTTSPYTTSTLSDGAHTFEVRGTDPGGNIDLTPALRSFSIGPVPVDPPPQTTITGGPAQGSTTTDQTPTFSFDSSDVGSTFEVRLDGGAWISATSPYTTPSLSNGSHTFEVRATDPAGNTDLSPASRTFTIGSVVPPPVVLQPQDDPLQFFDVGSLIVRLQATDGTWEVAGRDRFPGVVPESLELRSNAYGSDTCSFKLQRDPQLPHIDLAAYTAVEVENHGVRMFEGRIKETPTSEGDSPEVSVQCQGWQYHLDDDLLERNWVHTNLSEWRDVRSFVDASLEQYTASGHVEASQAISFGWSQSSYIGDLHHVGVMLDLGPSKTAERLVIEYERVGAATGLLTFVIRGSDVVNAQTGTYEDPLVTTFDFLSTPSGAASALFTKPRRYLTLLLHRNSGTPGNAGADHIVKITGAKAFGLARDEIFGQSILKASTVVKDVLPRAPLLNQDTSSIDPSGAVLFSIPDFHTTEPRTPRELIDAANVYHRYRIWVGKERRLEFGPYPFVPKYVIGSWGARNFQDQSTNSGEEIYNRAILAGTGPDGNPLHVERYSSQLPQAIGYTSPISSPFLNNASFSSNVIGWTIFGSSGGWAWVTAAGEYHTSPAAGRWQNYSSSSGAGASLVGDTTGTFKAYTNYVLTFHRRLSVTGGGGGLFVYLGVPDVDESRVWMPASTNNTAFDDFSIAWMPRADRTGVKVRFYDAYKLATPLYIDSFVLSVVAPTIIDRKGFTRTKSVAVSSPLVAEAAERILDAFLETHMKTPFKGGGVFFPGDIREWGTGREVHPRELLLSSGEIVHFSHLTDPDTGAQGRDGVIAEVSYSPDDEAATVAIDSSRDNLEGLLSRLGVVLSGG